MPFCCSPSCGLADLRTVKEGRTVLLRPVTSGPDRSFTTSCLRRRRVSAGRLVPKAAIIPGLEELQQLQVVKPQLTSILASAESAVNPVGGLAAFLLLLTG